MPYPALVHPEPLSLQQATADTHLCRRHSNTQKQVWLSLCGFSWCTQELVWAFQASLASMGFDSKHDFTPRTVYWGFSFALGSGIIFLVGSNILLLMVVQQCVAILEFLQEKMSAHPSIPPFHCGPNLFFSWIPMTLSMFSDVYYWPFDLLLKMKCLFFHSILYKFNKNFYCVKCRVCEAWSIFTMHTLL